jgi:hypothetical protein
LLERLDVQLDGTRNGEPPSDCEKWPTCDDHGANARLAMKFADSGRGGRALKNQLDLDLGAGNGPVRVERSENGVYRGAFCFERAPPLPQSASPCVRCGAAHGHDLSGSGRAEHRSPRDRSQGALEGPVGAAHIYGSSDGQHRPHRTLVITHDAVIKNEAKTSPLRPLVPGPDRKPFGNGGGDWTFGRLMTPSPAKEMPGTSSDPGSCSSIHRREPP